MKNIRIRENIEIGDDYVILNPHREGLETTGEFKQTGNIVDCFDALAKYLEIKWFGAFGKFREDIVKEVSKEEDTTDIYDEGYEEVSL